MIEESCFVALNLNLMSTIGSITFGLPNLSIRSRSTPSISGARPRNSLVTEVTSTSTAPSSLCLLIGSPVSRTPGVRTFAPFETIVIDDSLVKGLQGLQAYDAVSAKTDASLKLFDRQ